MSDEIQFRSQWIAGAIQKMRSQIFEAQARFQRLVDQRLSLIKWVYVIHN